MSRISCAGSSAGCSPGWRSPRRRSRDRVQRRAVDHDHGQPADLHRTRHRPARTGDRDLRRDRPHLLDGRACPVLPLCGQRGRDLRSRLRALHGAVHLHDLHRHGRDVRRDGRLGLLHGPRPLGDGLDPVHGAGGADPRHDREPPLGQRDPLLGHDLRRRPDLRRADRLRHAEDQAATARAEPAARRERRPRSRARSPSTSTSSTSSSSCCGSSGARASGSCRRARRSGGTSRSR